MSASVLVSGKLWRDPGRRVSRAGNEFVSATLRDGYGDDAAWWRLIVFSESACEELMTLKNGDSCAASGQFKAELYDRGGESKISLTCVADRVISAKRRKAERAKERQAERRMESAGGVDDEFNDTVAF